MSHICAYFQKKETDGLDATGPHGGKAGEREASETPLPVKMPIFARTFVHTLWKLPIDFHGKILYHHRAIKYDK